MKILVASDSFKGTLSSEQVGQVVKSVLTDDQVDVVSISDGGEGIIEALENRINGQRIEIDIRDPLGRVIKGYYLLTGQGLAVVESAVACGLGLLDDDEKNPLLTSTYGVGMMIDDALKRGANHILVGIGGTSTNDGGTGMLEALGVKFYGKDMKPLIALSGKDLSKIADFDARDLEHRLSDVLIEVACDVDNPLLGEHGASFTFGPQKGADKAMCLLLEKGMKAFADLVSSKYGDKTGYPGAGAAGGLGYCFVSCMNARLKSGIDLVLDVIDFDDLIKPYDMVITGEGKIDHQTTRGKVPAGILKRTTKQGIRTLAICGIQEGVVKGFEAVFSVVPSVASASQSLERPEEALKSLINDYVKTWIRLEKRD